MGVTTMWGTVVKGLSVWMIENCRVFFFFNDFFSVLKFSNRDSFCLSVTIIRGYLFYFWSNYHSCCSADFFLSQFTITIQEHYWFLNVGFVPICFSERESYHLCRLFRASACKIIVSADRHNFKFSISYIYPFQFFIHFICYSSTFTLSFVLSYSGKFVHIFHFLDFNGNALDFHQYTVLTIHLMHIVFIVLKYFPLILCCFRIFIVKE